MGTLTFDFYTKKIYGKVFIKKLYWCWDTAEGICSWFLPDATYSSKKGALRSDNGTM